MGASWDRVRRYSRCGWHQCSLPIFLFVSAGAVAASALGSAPFWMTFSALAPFLILYFPLAGFLLEVLERDWEDWHLW